MCLLSGSSCCILGGESLSYGVGGVGCVVVGGDGGDDGGGDGSGAGAGGAGGGRGQGISW